MKIVVGLGNPGRDYENTRHNVGYMVVNSLKEIKLSNDVLVKKTNVFMNNSGQFVEKLTKLCPLSSNSLYIIHDDLDIPLGSYKIQFGVGPKVHNGVNSVEEALGTKDFWRVRIGIENRAQRSELSGEEYVLQDFTKEEKIILDGVIEKICKELNSLLQ
jgi:peptidyl-tRNA hydrolase, PTH1 family